MTAVTTGAPAPRVRRPPSGTAGAHLSGISAIVAVVVLLVAFAAAGSVITSVMRPAKKPACPNVVTCLSPGQKRGPDRTQAFTNSALGYSFQYPVDVDTVTTLNANTVKVVAKNFDDRLFITVVPASQLTPEAALQTQLESDKASFNLGAVDTTSMNRIVSPQIGFVPGVGGAYNGVIESASEPVNDAILAASNGRLTVYMSFAVGTAHDNTANAARALAADLIVDSFTWNS